MRSWLVKTIAKFLKVEIVIWNPMDERRKNAVKLANQGCSHWTVEEIEALKKECLKRGKPLVLFPR